MFQHLRTGIVVLIALGLVHGFSPQSTVAEIDASPAVPSEIKAEDLAADLALMQGTWELDPENKLNGLVANLDLKIIEGNKETVRRFDRKTGKLQHEHSIEFALSKSGGVRVLTFYAVGGSPEHGFSYIYKVDKKNFFEVSGMLQGDDYRNYRERPRAWYWRRFDKEIADVLPATESVEERVEPPTDTELAKDADPK